MPPFSIAVIGNQPISNLYGDRNRFAENANGNGSSYESKRDKARASIIEK